MKKLIFILLFSICGIQIWAQEQPHYSLYMLRQSLINPAALSTFDEVSGALFFNYKMVGFNGAPLVGALDVSVPVGKTGLTVGFLTQQDKIGATYKSTIGLNVSYRIRLNPKNYLAFGINGSAYMINANFNSLTVQNPIDPVLNSGFETFWSPNFKIGAYYFRKNFYLGYAVGNVLTVQLPNAQYSAPQIQARFQDVHHYVQTGFQVHMGSYWKLQPSFLVKFVPGSPIQFDANLQFNYYDRVGFGVCYRSLNSALIHANVLIAKKFTIGYGFTMGFGFENRTNYTGHELMLGFKIPSTKNRIPVDVPRF